MRADHVEEAAALLRALVEAVPPSTATERATARRIEGAAIALDALADAPSTGTLTADDDCGSPKTGLSKTTDSETA